MLLRRFYDPKLAQASYLIGSPSSGKALVVDPNRDVDPYLAAAAEEGLRVTHVTETHIHADFVSGARELTHRAGAQLLLSDAGGSDWGYRYTADANATLINDGHQFRVGMVEIRVLHVPGHTPEHLAFLVTDTETASEPMGAVTGDFLFVGDVGRPDLLERAVHAKGTMERSARQLFQSLQRFRALPDYLQIWPGHGAGSACGKALGAVPQSTLGYEKRFNWAFGVTDESTFVTAVLAGQPDPPPYFAQMKRMNQTGPRLLGAAPSPPRRSVGDLSDALERGATVVDTRPAAEFARGAVPGTINIPATRAFTTWAGSLLPYDSDFYLLVDDGRGEAVRELVRDLIGIGLDRIQGYFEAGVVEAWSNARGGLERFPGLSVAEVQSRSKSNNTVMLDVRSAGEWKTGHLPGSLNVPVAELDGRLGELPRDRLLIVHCQTGARAGIAASILRARGFRDVALFPGGFAEWRSAGQAVESS
jgi:hydroxyacylglutathione hydrolase